MSLLMSVLFGAAAPLRLKHFGFNCVQCCVLDVALLSKFSPFMLLGIEGIQFRLGALYGECCFH